ncbi:MAG: hypothetical protein RLZZ77_2384 [Bacteroidota bacterium]|jgi:hypothetical protein
MKANKKTIWALVALTVVGSLSSCTKNFDSINTDPNNPTEVPTSYLLTGAQKGLMDNTWDAFWGAQVGNQLAQYWASNQYASESRYQFRTGVTNGYWGLLYAGGSNDAGYQVGGLKELQDIIDLCEATPDKYAQYGDPNNQIAVATTLKCWAMQMITDTWGDVPYSEALGGVANTQPKYDSQREIYLGLMSDINQAISLINESESGPQGDIIYSGDMSAWRRFANSLKMRIAMRMADREPAMAATAIQEAVTDGVMQSNADNALFHYLGAEPNFSLYYFNYAMDGRNDYAASNVMVDVLAALNDPRMSEYYAPAASSGEFVGEIYGQTDADAASTPDEDVSQRSEKVLSADLPGIYMDYAETCFILAEAVKRGMIGGDAAEYYNNGISASFEYWGAGDASSYISQPTVDYATLEANGDSYKQIIGKQKWIALYMQGLQGWAEYRRLDFGILQLPAGGSLDGAGIPFRMRYPIDEQTLNGGSYSNAVSNQGPDTHDTRLWWDVN